MDSELIGLDMKESSNCSATSVEYLIIDYEKRPWRRQATRSTSTEVDRWYPDVACTCGQESQDIKEGMTMTEEETNGEHSWLAATVLADHTITGGGGRRRG